MSGTSLDGLDIAYCNFSIYNSKWVGKVIAAKTYKYSTAWRQKLSTVESKTALDISKLHSEFGQFSGKKIKEFISEFNLHKEIKKENVFVSSHGHTIFHQPLGKNNKMVKESEWKNEITPFTFQLGNGAAIATCSDLPVVCDFRTADVALGGQGAPLVPIGDALLFSDFAYCLNIGGIANVSFEKKKTGEKNSKSQRIAFDICPANMVLNHFANISGKEFDSGGEIAKSGKINFKLLNELNALEFYLLNPPKSLGKEWVTKEFFPVIDNYKIHTRDKMRTLVEHIAIQIGLQLKKMPNQFFHPRATKEYNRILVTGGGAHNKFLIQRIKANFTFPLFIPEKKMVDFKEALIFGFLGVLRMRNEINCLSSVTGAARDNCGGAVYKP